MGDGQAAGKEVTLVTQLTQVSDKQQQQQPPEGAGTTYQ